MTRTSKFLISCSGAVEDILDQPECRADATKYAMVGMIVLLTAVFAFFSSTFALYAGVGALPLAMMLGTAWALMIFTLDRFVVSGIRKSNTDGLQPEQRWRKRAMEWVIALPRIALAALISVVVATPLELRFFQREIDVQLEKTQTLERQTAGNELEREFDEATTLRSKNDELRKGIDDAWSKYAAMSALATRELAGQALTAVKGDGPVYQRLRSQAEDLRTLAEQTQRKHTDAIARNDEQIGRVDKERERRLAQAEKTIDKSGGFLARYGALGQMADSNPDVKVARTFLMLLFLIVEISPVLTKLLLPRGPYDDFIETLEHRVRVTKLTERSHMNDDAHADVAIHTSRNSERVLLEQSLTADTYKMDKVRSVAGPELENAQRELACASVEEWRRKQRKLFDPVRPSRMAIRKPARAEDPKEAPSS
jgi:hypothetical protein